MQLAGSLAQTKFWQRSLYKLCGESGGDGARFWRLCRNNSPTRETIPPASQAAYMFSLYCITLFYVSAVKDCSFLPITFFKNLSTAFQNSAYNAPLSFHKRQKHFWGLGVNNSTNCNRSISRKRSDYNTGKYGHYTAFLLSLILQLTSFSPLQL